LVKSLGIGRYYDLELNADRQVLEGDAELALRQLGGLLNASDLGRSLGISYHTVQKALDIVNGHFLTRRLEPYHANVGNRLVKAPKVYIRD